MQCHSAISELICTGTNSEQYVRSGMVYREMKVFRQPIARVRTINIKLHTINTTTVRKAGRMNTAKYRYGPYHTYIYMVWIKKKASNSPFYCNTRCVVPGVNNVYELLLQRS